MSGNDEQLLYEQLVKPHWREIYTYALRLSGNRSDAEDVVQDTYLQAWKSIGALRDRGAARSWLYTIARRGWWRMRESRNESQSLDGLKIPDRRNDQRTTDELDSVQRSLDRLDRTFRDPFLMVAMEGLSCRQVANELKLPLGTVLSRIARAREKLKCILDEDSKAAGFGNNDRAIGSGGSGGGR